MTLPHTFPSGSLLRNAAKLASVGAVALALVQAPLIRASDAPSLRQLDDKAPALPLTGTFSKNASSEAGPYVLTLENTGKDTVTVSAKILLAVQSHAASKARDVPAHAIEAGKTWSLSDLAAGDKVILSADGFAPMELTVP